MSAPVSFIPAMVKIVTNSTTGVNVAVNALKLMRTNIQQAGQWTTPLETSYQAALTAAGKNPSYKP